MVSPSSLATRFRLRMLILPDESSSNRLNTFMMSSRESLSDCTEIREKETHKRTSHRCHEVLNNPPPPKSARL